ncbi:putative SOS response-associated peptidase YedK [Natronocella acetinitrilica]|uniref:Abasic site processing protein n=1 Tax=Natronocella acetinitrilica TaxID=414046 RepID=A0AAE3G4T7_9GAMM|nr:SOS response-associated peptidase [Natronocella acetinitrilica]MCP1674413.1 putative SOS response-associated peptidase YedK [Natronocella acetinitrilica]
MCGRYALYSPRSRIAGEFGVTRNVGGNTPRYNIAPGTAPLTLNARAETLAFEQLRWGYRPHWASAESPTPINARAERVATSPYFREAFAHHRCLVPADGWYEWQAGEGGKQPYYHYHAEGALLYFAGVYACTPDGAPAGFAIITVPAKARAATVHPRMPLILAPACLGAWMDPAITRHAAIREASVRLDSEVIALHAVSTRVNRSDAEDASLIEPPVP